MCVCFSICTTRRCLVANEMPESVGGIYGEREQAQSRELATRLKPHSEATITHFLAEPEVK